MRTRSILCLAAMGATAAVAGGVARAALPECGLAYRIEARFDPKTRVIDGSERIAWTNRTGAAAATLPLHLYLNGFSSQATTWMRDGVEIRTSEEKWLAKDPDPWGYDEPVSIVQVTSAGERKAAWRYIRPDDGNPFDTSLAEITLPEPVADGASTELAIVFRARLPWPLARTGAARDFALFGQWFPKLGMIEAPGVRHAKATRVAARQFHGTTEFYAEFADWDVTLTVPEGWVVGATGARAAAPGGAPAGSARHRFVQRAVHDFALVAGAGLVDVVHRHRPAGGGPEVEVHVITPRFGEHQVPRWARAVDGALDVLGARVGPYPYATLTLAMMPGRAAATSGMEYPTFITGEPPGREWDRWPARDLLMVEGTIVHEMVHQYFYGLCGSNEQEEGYLDEGFTTYWSDQAQAAIYGPASFGRILGRNSSQFDVTRAVLGGTGDGFVDPLARRPTWMYAGNTAFAQIYFRTGATLETAARLFGRERLDRVFAAYVARFAFRHPDLDDFLDVARETGGEALAAQLREAFERPRLPDYAVDKLEVARFEAPLGRVATPKGILEIKRGEREKQADAVLPDDAREKDGKVAFDVGDPGTVRDGVVRIGTIAPRRVTPARGKPAATHDAKAYYESRARLTGPGWDHLPVEVVFRFDDGATITDAWDGQAPWRTYRFLRAARLVEVRIDPRDTVVLDPTPQNNARRLSADNRLVADWTAWLAAAAAWLAHGALSCF